MTTCQLFGPCPARCRSGLPPRSHLGLESRKPMTIGRWDKRDHLFPGPVDKGLACETFTGPWLASTALAPCCTSRVVITLEPGTTLPGRRDFSSVAPGRGIRRSAGSPSSEPTRETRVIDNLSAERNPKEHHRTMSFLRHTTMLIAFGATVLGAQGARGADPPPRLVLLDALVLPPRLEKANVRATVEQRVAEAAHAHGWEAVSIATDCRDLGCAGAVARAAKTLYVLILVGRYAAGDTYATDLGASLWHEGNVISSRSESDELAERDKVPGAVMLRCGPPDGACTPELLISKLESYAGKLLDQESAAIKARAAAAAVVALPPPAPAPAPVVPIGPTPQEGRGGRILGWSLVGGGVVLAGGAIALWAANSSDTQCNTVPGDSAGCRSQRKTTTAAVIAGVGAAAAAAAGVVVLLTADRAPARLALSVHPSGVSLEGRF